MELVVFVVDWNYHFLIASGCLHLCNRMNISFFIYVNHPWE